MKKLPDDVLEFFRQQGAKGGKRGGKRSLETMTAEERKERARKAGKKGAAARWGKKPAAKKRAVKKRD